MSDWYKITFTEISQHGGHGLISEYDTITDLFQSIYPEYEWDKYQFEQLPHGFLKLLNENPASQKDFVEYLEKKFNIKETSDWYLISTEQLNKVISMKLSDAMSIVKQYYPMLEIKNFEFKAGNTMKTKKSQYILKSMIKSLFPHQEILEDYRSVDLDYLELDYYLPNLKLAFEYQVRFTLIFL